MTENQQRAEQAVLFPLGPFPPTYSVTTKPCGLPQPGEHLRLLPLYVTGKLRQRKEMAQMKEQIKVPDKIQLSNEEIANLSMHSSKHW